ncbi:MAG TPA: 50S ribosomal protein L29 [Chloroflexota bacterium]|nr:50S ribosomal protein L29 [Chloroflexota bacterium]
MKSKDIRDMSPDEQLKQLNEAHQELFNLRFQLATRQLQNYRRIREVRRNIARLNGIIAEQHRAEEA